MQESSDKDILMIFEIIKKRIFTIRITNNRYYIKI